MGQENIIIETLVEKNYGGLDRAESIEQQEKLIIANAKLFREWGESIKNDLESVQHFTDAISLFELLCHRYQINPCTFDPKNTTDAKFRNFLFGICGSSYYKFSKALKRLKKT